jgi:hypothetical protein
MTFKIKPHSCQLNILIRRKLIFTLMPIKPEVFLEEITYLETRQFC